MQSPESRWLGALIAAGTVAFGAWRLRALTIDGALAALATGWVIVSFAGWWPGVILIAFFASSSALSLARAHRTATVQLVRGNRRDAVQVAANGLVPALLAIGGALANNDSPWKIAMAAAIAGAAADTWATETGRLSQSPPRSITTWKPAAPGTSGAVSTVGTAGALAGAVFIAVVAVLGYAAGWNVHGVPGGQLFIMVAFAGFMGSLADSLLGATLQGMYRCTKCGELTEQRVHRCGGDSELIHGFPGVTNDVVNFLAISVAAAIGFALTSTIG